MFLALQGGFLTTESPGKPSLCFLIGLYSFRSYILLSLICLELTFYMAWDKGPVLFSYMWIYSFLSTVIRETVLSPVCVVGNVLLTINVWIYFWALYSAPLVYMFLLMPVSGCFGYQSFMVYFEIQVCAASNIVFCLFFFCLELGGSLKIVSAFQGLLWFHMNFRIFVFSFCKKCH